LAVRTYMWVIDRVDFLLNWPNGLVWALYVWQFVESTSFIIRTESSSRKEATADDSDNGASGYTDWDCIFHLHFKMQMSRRVVLRTPFPIPVPFLLPFPPRLLQNASMAQMRTNLYARTLWIRIRFRMGKCISWAGGSVLDS